MVTGVAYAQLGWLPVIVITWQKPIKQSKQWRFQVLDVVAMMEPLTKYATSIVNIHRIPSTIRQSFKTAQEEKPWAVHIELAEDIAREETDDNLSPVLPHKIRRPQIDEKWLAQVIEAIKSAKRPIILVGAWANRKRITNYLTKFIQKTNMPFFSSMMGKWVVNETLPQSLWTAALTSNDYIHDAIDLADCIIAVGHDVVEKPTNVIQRWDVKLLHISFTTADIDQLYAPDLEVIGDIWNTFWQLFESDELKEWMRDFSEIYKINQSNKEKIAQTTEAEYTNELLGPRRLARELRAILHPSDILTMDNWLYKVRLARNYRAAEANTVLLDNALATMWAWLWSAMIAKELHPDKNVVCIVWDGGFMMNLWDFETAVRLGNNLTIILLNDHAYGMIKWKQHNMWFTDFWLDLHNPDFQQLATAFWANAMKVEKADDFADTMRQALKQDGVTLVEVSFAYPEKID